MPKSTQVTKNIILSKKFLDYLLTNPDIKVRIPSDANIVVFSADDSALNRSNQQLLESLQSEEKPVIKVEQTKDKKAPWKVTPYTFA